MGIFSNYNFQTYRDAFMVVVFLLCYRYCVVLQRRQEYENIYSKRVFITLRFTEIIVVLLLWNSVIIPSRDANNLS